MLSIYIVQLHWNANKEVKKLGKKKKKKTLSPPDIKNGHGALKVHKRSSNKKQVQMKSIHPAPAILP